MRFLYRAVIVALFAGCMFSTTLVGFPAPPNSDRTTNSGISGQTATGPKTEQSSFWAPDPNQLYSYNLSETSQRNYAWSPFSTGNITIDTPASYNTSTANVYLRVMNTTLNESTVVDHDPNGLNSRAEQVQGFTLVMDANLTGFSIFVPTFQPASQVLMKLLNSTAGVPDSTKVITSFTVPSFLGGNLWLNYTFLNPVFMLAGHYYLYMNSTTPFQNAWGKTADGIKGDAYVNDSGTWDQQTWNLTLKLWKYDALTPSSVGMNVSGQPVQDSGPGQGWANVSQNFTDSPISFQVVNNTPVTYAADANMSLRVWNATLNESTVVNFDPTQFASRYEQAQGFTTGMDANLSGFSIFVPTSQPTSQIWMAIRNNTYNGQNISSFVVNYAGGNYWLNVTFPTSIFLPKGHYYLYMAAASPSNNAWGHSDSGIPGDAWANNGGWSLQPWNLSLQLQKYDVVNPSAVGLSITGQAVTDLGNGQGWANVSQNFTQSPIQFSVTNSTPNNYNAFANLSMQVMNSTLNDSTIINVDGTGSSKNQQTQGFYTYVDANLSGFSIYVISNNQKPTVTLEILNNSYSTGNIIWSNNSIPLSNTVNAWLNVSFPQSIFLPKGHYYLLMTAVTGNPNQWAHTTTSTTGDTFVYSGSWSPAGWDLTLKLRKYDVVDPTAVGMTVSGLPVANLGNGRGWVNVSQNFTSPTISFAVTNSTPITYQVTANVTFRVWNTTLNTSTFINFDPSQFGSRYEQTQGFTMGSDAYLAGFSIFVPTSQPTSQIGMELRNTTYNGPTIAGSAVVVNYIGGNAWLNVTFPTSIFMLKGQYYLYMDASGPTYNAWGQTTTGVPGDAWIYNQTTSNWERQNWNLTLQLDKFDVVDPIVGMSVLGQPVANLGNGWGWVNVSQNFTSSPIMFPVSNSTPIFYSVFANLTIHVMSATVNETTLIDYSTDASSSRFEQAQGFFMSTDSFLSGLSIFVPTTNTATQITMEIRNSTYAGQSVYSFPVNYAGVNDWLNLTFYPTLYLPQGHYYLYMPLSSPSANAWGRTVSGGTGDTWANNGSWGLQGWNLTLKLDAYNSVNPSSVFMNLTGQGITQAVSDLGNGYGWANVTQSITGPTQELDIVNSTPVLYSYQVNASYFASMPLATSVSLDQNPPNWTV
ncbi:MAG TPA: hypothetical protein VKK79_05835, partial [Candidatus Lokiarchaeia archaeon]|nr:hypothetical protein [Candidatus Lokiarchaeia archaeon]